jgi:hypothetical protein
VSLVECGPARSHVGDGDGDRYGDRYGDDVRGVRT